MFILVEGKDGTELICNTDSVFLNKRRDSSNTSGFVHIVTSDQGLQIVVSEDKWLALKAKLLNLEPGTVLVKDGESPRIEESEVLSSWIGEVYHKLLTVEVDGMTVSQQLDRVDHFLKGDKAFYLIKKGEIRTLRDLIIKVINVSTTEIIGEEISKRVKLQDGEGSAIFKESSEEQ